MIISKKMSAAPLSLTDTFLRLGIDELSVSPTSVLPLRNVIRNH